MSISDEKKEVCERLLDEAELLFAQRGYQGVSVREITSASKCNAAAVSYYFRGKKNLYLEVFRQRWIARAKRNIRSMEEELASKDQISFQDLLEALYRTLLQGTMSDHERMIHNQLMTRELNQPCEAFELVLEEVIRPMIYKMTKFMDNKYSSQMDQESLILNALCILALGLYFNFARQVVIRLTGQTYDQKFITTLKDHLVEFVLYGLEPSTLPGHGLGKG